MAPFLRDIGLEEAFRYPADRLLKDLVHERALDVEILCFDAYCLRDPVKFAADCFHIAKMKSDKLSPPENLFFRQSDNLSFFNIKLT